MSAVVKLLRQERADLHVSASAIRSLQECPRRFWLHYVEGLPPQDRPARMILGSAVHAAVAHFYRAMLDGAPEPSHEAMLGIAASTITREAINDPPLLFDEGEDASTLVREASRLLDVFLVEGYRPKQVLGVEEPFVLDLADTETGEVFDEKLAGAMDLIAREDDATVTVVDHKVRARKDPAGAERPDIQMALYAWALQRTLGVEQVALAYQEIVCTKKSQVLLRRINRVDGDVSEAIEGVIAGLELVHLAVDHPNGKRLMRRRRSWMCKQCGWRASCG